MEKFIRRFKLYSLLMFFWVVLNGTINARILFYGSIICVVIIKMTFNVIFDEDNEALESPSAWRFMWFVGVVLISIIKASFTHVIRIIKNNNDYLKFSIELEVDNSVLLTLIANAITLTPGTITLNIEKTTLHVVGFGSSETDVQSMKEEVLKYQKPFIYNRR